MEELKMKKKLISLLVLVMLMVFGTAVMVMACDDVHCTKDAYYDHVSGSHGGSHFDWIEMFKDSLGLTTHAELAMHIELYGPITIYDVLGAMAVARCTNPNIGIACCGEMRVRPRHIAMPTTDGRLIPGWLYYCMSCFAGWRAIGIDWSSSAYICVCARVDWRQVFYMLIGGMRSE
jgi:hypothetical protein